MYRCTDEDRVTPYCAFARGMRAFTHCRSPGRARYVPSLKDLRDNASLGFGLAIDAMEAPIRRRPVEQSVMGLDGGRT
jgi:hypothetical protein